MARQFMTFLLRWLLNSMGIWLAVRLFGTGYLADASAMTMATFLVAGLVFSLVNAILKPIVIILSLPAILLTLGLFMIVVNGILVYISLRLAPGIHMTFWHSILTGLVLSLVNYIVSSVLELQLSKRQEDNS